MNQINRSVLIIQSYITGGFLPAREGCLDFAQIYRSQPPSVTSRRIDGDQFAIMKMK